MAVNTAINLAQTPAENILALLQLNAKDGVTITAADFSFAVTPLGAADPDGRNTTLTATSEAAGQFEEDAEVNFTYLRPAPAATLTFQSTDVAATALQIRAAIAAELKIHESEFDGWDDVVDHPGADQTVTVTLTADAASLLYTGTTTVTLNYVVPEPNPADAFDSTELDGFNLSA